MANKKIFIGIGCGLILIIAAVLTIVGFIIGGLYYAATSNEEFSCAMELAQKNDAVVEILGNGISHGFLVLPQITIEGSKREVYLTIPVSGSKSSGKILVSSYRDNFRDNFLATFEANGKQIPIHKGTFPCGE